MTVEGTGLRARVPHSATQLREYWTREMVGMQRVSVGDTVKVMLPWSEVCLHMRVSDQVRDVRVLADGAQILNDDGTRFCPAITHGEAGIMRDAEGFYVEPPR